MHDDGHNNPTKYNWLKVEKIKILCRVSAPKLDQKTKVYQTEKPQKHDINHIYARFFWKVYVKFMFLEKVVSLWSLSVLSYDDFMKYFVYAPFTGKNYVKFWERFLPCIFMTTFCWNSAIFSNLAKTNKGWWRHLGLWMSEGKDGTWTWEPLIMWRWS